MICPKCASEDVNVQAVGITKTKRKSCLYWLLVGWWLETIMWIFLTLPMLAITLFGSKKIHTKIKSFAVCQSCGHNWKIG